MSYARSKLNVLEVKWRMRVFVQKRFALLLCMSGFIGALTCIFKQFRHRYRSWPAQSSPSHEAAGPTGIFFQRVNSRAINLQRVLDARRR